MTEPKQCCRHRHLIRKPVVPAYLDAGGRRLDPDPPKLGHRRYEIAEEGTLVGRAVVDRAAQPHVGLEHPVGAHRRGVEEGEGIGVRVAGTVQLRHEAGIHGRVAADPHRQQPIFCLRPGPAAPWAKTRHYRVMVGGAADPATSPVTMHGAAQAFHRAHGNRRGQKC